MKKKLIPIFLCLNVIFLAGFVTSLKGQKGECLTDIRMELAQPMLKGSIDSSLLKFATREVKTRTQKSTTIIPVHVVVVHTPRQQVGTEDNISADVIRDQIAVLNRDFNRYNLDSTKTPDSFSTGGLDIYFCLAQIDPFGVSTEGITRYSSSLPFTANEFAIKEATGWPRSDYLNIYVTKLEDGNFGYSYIPSTTSLPDEILDGVVINVKNFGGSENTYNAGRTLVHEVGHFLGLKHIWGEDGCDNDDGITDTPPQDTANVGCPVHPKLSCSNLGDMFMNYMDYTADSCINAFTAEQVAYMSEILSTSRFNLTVSNKAPECSKIPPLRLLGVSRVLPRCFGVPTGSLELLFDGGLPPYAYFINGAQRDTSLFTGLSGGSYKLKVVDSQGKSDSTNFFLFEPDDLVIEKPLISYFGCEELTSDIGVSIKAKGGVVNANGYQYSLTNFPSNNSGVFLDVLSGIYKVVVRDANSCTDSLVFEVKKKKFLNKIPETLIQPSCFGRTDGVYRVGPSDSLKIYSYLMGGTLNKTGEFTNLAPNKYTLYIEDSTGCVFEKEVNIVAPNPLRIDSVITTQMPCFAPDTSKIIVMATGGTAPITYTVGNISSTQNTFVGQGTGKFFVSITDSRGCTDQLAQPIFNTQVGGLETNFLILDAFCSDNPSGRVVMQASGGSGTYNFYINGNKTASDVANLVPGFYVLTIEDIGTRCLQSKNVNLGIQPPMEVVVDTIVKKVNGKLQVVFTVTGGKPPYLYSLDGGRTFKSVPIFDDVTEGNFVLTVFDASNCQIQKSFLLTNNEELEDFGIKIYPNPFSEYIYLESTDGAIEDFNIELYNFNGQKLPESKYIKYNKEKYLIQLNTEALPNSIYFVKLAYRNRTSVYKIIKI